MKIPEEIAFQMKGQIALELIDESIHAGIPTRAIVADAGYGDQPSLLDGLQDRKLPYVVGVASTVQFRLAEAVEQDPGDGPPPAYQGIGRSRKALHMEDRIPAEGAATILAALPEEAWKTVAWREGTKGTLVKEFIRVQVYRTGLRGAHVPCKGWLVGERPIPGRRGDSKYYFAWGLDTLALEELVELAHLRWVIERFYQDAKGELGLDDYEGRLWTGLHRHVVLVMLAHSFLTLRQTYGPEITGQESTKRAHSGEQHTPPPRRRAFPPTGPEEPGCTKKGSHRRALPAGHRDRHSLA